MNDDETANFLDSLAEGVESRPPLQDILREGRVAARRRRAHRFVTGAVAAVVLVAGATTAVQGFAGSDRPAGEAPASGGADPVLGVAPGMRLVGLGRVVLEVPETWGTQTIFCSQQPAADTVYYESTSEPCLAAFDPGPISSVGMFRLDTDRGKAAAAYVTTQESKINGVSVLRGRIRCPAGSPDRCLAAAETEVVIVPAEGVVLTVRTGGDADADIDSLRLLPEGYTTVPYIEPGTPNGPAGNLIIGAGLRVDEAWESAPGGYSGRIPVAVVAPVAGSVVAVGSTVTIDRLDRPEDGDDQAAGEAESSALFDDLTFTLTLALPNANGVVRSRLRVQNPTDRTITDPGCRLFANYSFGVVPTEDPDGSLPGMTLTRCLGPQDLPPGYDETLPGPTFDVTNLPAGDYLASMDYRDLRSERLTAPLQVPPR